MEEASLGKAKDVEGCGGCDPGEHPDQTVMRELAEEAGLVPTDVVFLFETSDTQGSGQLLSVYAATWNGDETALPLSEGVRLQFFPPESLDVLAIPPHVRGAIARFMAR